MKKYIAGAKVKGGFINFFYFTCALCTGTQCKIHLLFCIVIKKEILEEEQRKPQMSFPMVSERKSSG